MKLLTNVTVHSAQELVCGGRSIPLFCGGHHGVIRCAEHDGVLSERKYGGVLTCEVDFADIGNSDMFASAVIRYEGVDISAVLTGMPLLRYYDSMRLADMDGMRLDEMDEI